MIPSPSLTDESARLRSLRTYDALPTLIEPIFDEFVALTAQVFCLPISLISVVEEDEVLYPANHGMPGNDRQPRVEAICSTAIQQSRAVVYHDVLLESAATLPAEALQAAQANDVRFYAGALLRMPDQQAIGTLCIIDRQPRIFTLAEQQLLDQLATLISYTIAVRHTCVHQNPTGLPTWVELRTQLQEELRELTALVRYLYTRHGTQIPVAAELLLQVERRLQGLRDLLQQYECH